MYLTYRQNRSLNSDHHLRYSGRWWDQNVYDQYYSNDMECISLFYDSSICEDDYQPRISISIQIHTLQRNI